VFCVPSIVFPTILALYIYIYIYIRPVLKVEEAGIPDHEQATGKLYSGVNVVGMVKEKIEVF
jgi:hypothetical protein